MVVNVATVHCRAEVYLSCVRFQASKALSGLSYFPQHLELCQVFRVLVCLACHKKYYTWGFRQQVFISHSSEGWGVQDQGVKL